LQPLQIQNTQDTGLEGNEGHLPWPAAWDSKDKYSQVLKVTISSSMMKSQAILPWM
jgi:hypothetical protein